MIDQTRPVVLLVSRIAIGVIFLVHGYQKFVTMGIAGTAEFFAAAGIPLPGLAAPAVAGLEVAGGLALVLGAALPVAGSLLALDMIGAIVFVHGANGLAGDGGYEFVLALAAASLAVGFTGGGALALDNALARRRPAQPATT
ncbi:Putative oxidoreductase MhqP [Nonomuraea coxensis DSM 45129]|uniref:Oxidoreductase MhqP n=1 Tax=Nonomuraea coxensis DSM 45129 TaxID=1122611 RepID=A0ABX8TYL9_9ACTN|nr:DoxX family protein [Nonomuraea coxensis]QYC40581.1 Putative oxidoreductase MhqP [Nonomuraea coxensis DSM 45129]